MFVRFQKFGKEQTLVSFLALVQRFSTPSLKIIRIRSFTAPCFPAFGLHISPYSVQMWENTDQKNSKYGHFQADFGTTSLYLCKVIKLLPLWECHYQEKWLRFKTFIFCWTEIDTLKRNKNCIISLKVK